MTPEHALFQSQMNKALDKLELQKQKVDMLRLCNKITNERKNYAENLIVFDFILKEAAGLARVGELEESAKSFAEGKRAIDKIIKYVIESDASKSLYYVARRRYDSALRQVDFILENRGVAA